MLLRYPGIIRCGWGCRRQLPDVIAELQAGSTYVLVSGGSDRYTAVHDEFAGLIAPPLTHFKEVLPEPELACVDALKDLLRELQPELVVAVGGGSVIDTAKAAAAIAPGHGDVQEYFDGRREVTARGIPLIALPTTAGTGAEITKNAVLTDPAAGVKKSIRSAYMVPAAALCDAELTMTLPPPITAASGLDALTQAIESYITRKATNATRALAGAAVRLLTANLPGAYAGERAGREGVAEGSLLGAMSFSQSGLGAVHGLAHPLGAVLHLPHGYVCAVLLPHILRFNLPVCTEKLAELGHQTGLDGADAFVRRIAELCTELGLPASFAADGLRPEHHAFIVANCRSNSMTGNPREMTDAEVLALLQQLSR